MPPQGRRGEDTAERSHRLHYWMSGKRGQSNARAGDGSVERSAFEPVKQPTRANGHAIACPTTGSTRSTSRVIRRALSTFATRSVAIEAGELSRFPKAACRRAAVLVPQDVADSDNGSPWCIRVFGEVIQRQCFRSLRNDLYGTFYCATVHVAALILRERKSANDHGLRLRSHHEYEAGGRGGSC